MNLTPWYPVGTTPARPGVYQRSRVLPDGTRTTPIFAAWENSRWYTGGDTVDGAAAAVVNHDASIWPNGLEWRGLSEDPTT